MDASETEKSPKAGNRQAAAREARLAQALRANLRRRKSSDASPTPPPKQGAPNAQD